MGNFLTNNNFYSQQNMSKKLLQEVQTLNFDGAKPTTTAFSFVSLDETFRVNGRKSSKTSSSTMSIGSKL
uniref:Uncharacterized protein n=1 Tax=Romanomermis culicivorax TaxID=13658 RepID=A0A915HX94_ROMCU